MGIVINSARDIAVGIGQVGLGVSYGLAAGACSIVSPDHAKSLTKDALNFFD